MKKPRHSVNFDNQKLFFIAHLLLIFSLYLLGPVSIQKWQLTPTFFILLFSVYK